MKVEIHDENNQHEEIVEEYLENLTYLDDYLVKLCNKIVFTDQNVSKAANIKEELDIAIGYTDTKKKIIYINIDEYDSMIIMHEFFHLLDEVNRETPYSETITFQNLVKENLDTVPLSIYESSSWHETFVGLMLKYRYQPELLKSQSIEIYTYLDTLLIHDK